MAPIHDRMPVILGPAAFDRWLDAATPAKEAGMLRPLPGKELEAFAVSSYVSKAGNEGPRCVEPLAVSA